MQFSVTFDPHGRTSERYKGPNGKTSEIHYSDVSDHDLAILQRLQDVEEKLKTGHGQTVTLQEDSVTKEQEFEQEAEQMKINYETEIQALKQENFILQTKVIGFRIL